MLAWFAEGAFTRRWQAHCDAAGAAGDTFRGMEYGNPISTRLNRGESTSVPARDLDPFLSIAAALAARCHVLLDVPAPSEFGRSFGDDECVNNDTVGSFSGKRTEGTSESNIDPPTSRSPTSKSVAAAERDIMIRAGIQVGRAISEAFGWGDSIALRSKRRDVGLQAAKKGSSHYGVGVSAAVLRRDTGLFEKALGSRKSSAKFAEGASNVVVVEISSKTTPEDVFEFLLPEREGPRDQVEHEERRTDMSRQSATLPDVLVLVGAHLASGPTSLALASLLERAHMERKSGLSGYEEGESNEERSASPFLYIDSRDLCTAVILQFSPALGGPPIPAFAVPMMVAMHCSLCTSLAAFPFPRPSSRTRSRAQQTMTAYAPPVLVAMELLRVRAVAKSEVFVHQDVEVYGRDLVSEARMLTESTVPEAPPSGLPLTASQDLVLLAQVLAALRGRDFLGPNDISDLFIPILGHRIIPRGGVNPQTDRRESAIAMLSSVIKRRRAPL